MSIISQLGPRYENLPDILTQYDDEISLADDRIRIKGKPLGKANEEQAGWLMYYEGRRVEVKALVKFFEGRVSAVRGKLFRQYTETYSRELSDRAKEKYIDHDKEYTDVYSVLIEVEEIYEKYVAVVDAIRNRGFALRNLTDLAVNQLTDYTL